MRPTNFAIAYDKESKVIISELDSNSEIFVPNNITIKEFETKEEIDQFIIENNLIREN